MKIIRDKAYLNLSTVKLNVSIFYTLEVGFEETEIIIPKFLKEQKFLVVTEDYPYEKSKNEDEMVIKIKKFKVDKKFLKKV